MLNGARLIVTSFSDNLIAAKFDTGTFKDQIILIPSIIITPSDTISFYYKEMSISSNKCMCINN